MKLLQMLTDVDDVWAKLVKEVEDGRVYLYPIQPWPRSCWPAHRMRI